MQIYDHDVRTTLTLEDDVAKLLTDEMRRSRSSLKATVNHFLRLGLTRKGEGSGQFVVEPRPMGLPPGLSYDNVEELLDAMDGLRRR